MPTKVYENHDPDPYFMEASHHHTSSKPCNLLWEMQEYRQLLYNRIQIFFPKVTNLHIFIQRRLSSKSHYLLRRKKRNE
jgi:hypothetical protein